MLISIVCVLTALFQHLISVNGASGPCLIMSAARTGAQADAVPLLCTQSACLALVVLFSLLPCFVVGVKRSVARRDLEES